MKLLSPVQLFATPWTVAYQAPLSMRLFRQEYWRGLPFLPPGNLSDPGTKPASPVSPALQVESLPTEPSGKPIRVIPLVFLTVKNTKRHRAPMNSVKYLN